MGRLRGIRRPAPVHRRRTDDRLRPGHRRRPGHRPRRRDAPGDPALDRHRQGFINFGSGPYADSGFIASGSPQAWYTSPQVAALYGGTPNPAQQAAFTSTVLQLTEQAFSQSGVPVTLTTNPTVPAAHTLSVVSNSSSIPFPSSIGTTTLGGSGFSFIDREAQASSSVGQLEQILAHNLAHELMLAFGVPEKFDQTGNYLDATNANWAMMISPMATFSPAAAQAINQALQSANSPERRCFARPVHHPAGRPRAGDGPGLGPRPARRRRGRAAQTGGGMIRRGRRSDKSK